MASVLVEDILEVRSETDSPAAKRPRKGAASIDRDELLIELGVWLSGLESFLAAGHQPFGDAADRDASKEFRLVHSTLQRCSMLNARLLGCTDAASGGVTLTELRNLGSVLREATLLSEGIIDSDAQDRSDWKAWSSMFANRLGELPAFSRLIHHAESEGEKYLPEKLIRSIGNNGNVNAGHAELAQVLPRFGKVLKWLSVVGKMLERDEPLKPALLIFARVNEQVFELTTYINNRLERFPSEEAELFASLDAASYTASVELKKVYSQELAGITNLRPAPSVFARVETAHSLLSDGFQQIVAGFARLVDPKIDIFKLFPNFQQKLDHSLVLRNELRHLADVVTAAEQDPSKKNVEELQKSLREFMKDTVRFLFYKDAETVERFVEEILVTRQNKDLVPILHRFGAYLETLFSQVSLRTLLEAHPFGEKK